MGVFVITILIRITLITIRTIVIEVSLGFMFTGLDNSTNGECQALRGSGLRRVYLTYRV